MTNKKKTSPQTTSGLSTGTAAAVAKTAPRTASAATHKSSARKPPAEKTTATRTAVATVTTTVTFDAAAHQDEIARVAYFLWLDGGASTGTEASDWNRAIEIVSARQRGR
jgi:hypothetical protein